MNGSNSIASGTVISGCISLAPPVHRDGRGSFVKPITSDTLRSCGVAPVVGEIFWSRSALGVVRGLHFQRPPADATKVIWCTHGAVFDVVLDLRTDSPTYQRWVGFEISDENGRAVVVPEGCAHGFLSLTDGATVCYLQSGPHDPELEGGIRWDSAGITWPATGRDVILSARDAAHPPLDEYDSPFRVS
jgi:dTDP-4-dehydrorhamnose 3,5-epimerase